MEEYHTPRPAADPGPLSLRPGFVDGQYVVWDAIATAVAMDVVRRATVPVVPVRPANVRHAPAIPVRVAADPMLEAIASAKR